MVIAAMVNNGLNQITVSFHVNIKKSIFFLTIYVFKRQRRLWNCASNMSLSLLKEVDNAKFVDSTLFSFFFCGNKLPIIPECLLMVLQRFMIVQKIIIYIWHAENKVISDIYLDQYGADENLISIFISKVNPSNFADQLWNRFYSLWF